MDQETKLLRNIKQASALLAIPALVFSITCLIPGNGANAVTPELKPVHLEITSAELSREELKVQYSIYNRGKEDVSFILHDALPDPSTNWPRLPFITTGREKLVLSNYISDDPTGPTSYEVLYSYPVNLLKAGESFQGTIGLILPVRELPPYSDQSPLVNFDQIQSVRLIIAIIPCGEPEKFGSHMLDKDGKQSKFIYIGGNEKLDCGDGVKSLRKRQILLSDEKPLKKFRRK